MGSNCCQGVKFEGVSSGYKRILWIVIAINFTMFLVEISAGWNAQSQALKADALDFLADSTTYAISLYVIGKSIQLRSTAALFKGISLSLIGVWVLASTLYRLFVAPSPEPFIMGSVAMLALIANLLSVLLLIKYRDGDSNVRSVWLCSRNDAIGNIAVLLAAAAVWQTKTPWPDLLVALLMASLFLSSSFQIIKQSLDEKRQASEQPTPSCQTRQ
ncbi:cation diffusion facilitator family transporter [Motiliproteus sp. MSK22-1]|uniref:cation diffusion facilitator family transporter n=1 Tax=Motiliproteus sp. MSK22-1 TaxID=1897630 RepID=UPI00097802CF|nr:cation diffusion facilitator family transporter [Motiliproteus sp. MSK22-1]OMH33288.1 cation transporter [Motiliproteus sp. MSK22-1]